MKDHSSNSFMINEQTIKREQIEFFKKHQTGCSFAALAAKNPQKYGWIQSIVGIDTYLIENEIHAAIENPGVTTVSLIFPEVVSARSLTRLVDVLQSCPCMLLEQRTLYENSICFGFRVKVGTITSWVSGFGKFSFLPKTRQAPYTEIAFRVKRRPHYDWVMKESPPNVIHLADLDMLGLSKAIFQNLWNNSLSKTAELLGHRPDLRSAAKTTFAIPKEIYSHDDRQTSVSQEQE